MDLYNIYRFNYFVGKMYNNDSKNIWFNLFDHAQLLHCIIYHKGSQSDQSCYYYFSHGLSQIHSTILFWHQGNSSLQLRLMTCSRGD